MTYTSVFGSIIAREQIEQAVIATLRTPPPTTSFPLIQYFLGEFERQRGLTAGTLPPPPGASSYRGGVDFDVFEQEWAPMIMVVAEPVGTPERAQEGTYGSWFEIRVGALVTEQDEDSARVLADRYGACLATCLLQNGGLGTRTDFSTGSTVPLASRTVMETAPETTFPNPRMRRLAQSTVTLRSFVDAIAQDTGPISFPASPYTAPSAWPTISTVDVQLAAENASGVFNTATGVTVTEPSNGGTININE